VAKLYVFDLDGTLADTSQDIAVTLHEVWREMQIPQLTDSQVIRFIGHGARYLVAGCLEASWGRKPEASEIDPILHGFLERYARYPARYAQVFPGVEAVLRLLQPASCCVLTNKPMDPAMGVLQALRLASFFKEVVAGDSGFGLKPSPAGLHHLMEKWGSQPHETCLIGDGPQDQDTAKAAGIRFYGFLGGIGKPNPRQPSASEEFFGTFADLATLLKPSASA
jgi:phosphoglycolate phosphatase